MKTLKITALLAASSALCFARAATAEAADAPNESAGSTEPTADTSGASKRQVTISGETFEIAIPYSAGHELNEAEASVLNQTYLENIRNNVTGKIKAAREAAEKAGTQFSLDAPIGGEGADAAKTLRQVCTEYAQSYEFGVRTIRNAEPADPVDRQARAIAREVINGQLKSKGVKRKDVSDEAYEQAVTNLAGREDIRTEAQRRVEAQKSIGLEELGLAPAAPAAEAGSDTSGG